MKRLRRFTFSAFKWIVLGWATLALLPLIARA